MPQIYPPVSFYYQVFFTGIIEDTIDTRFQSVSGLSAEIQTESYPEGGENRFNHVLPVRTRYSDLVLKRGLVKDSRLLQWFSDTFDSMQVRSVTIDIQLLNEESEPLMNWNVEHAWPKRWSISEFHAQENAIAIETLELHYRSFSIIN